MAVKNAMTNDFLHSAYGGESMAHMRYLYWSNTAEKEGFPNIARLFKAIAYAEQVHASNHFRAIGGRLVTARSLQELYLGPIKRQIICKELSTANSTRLSRCTRST